MKEMRIVETIKQEIKIREEKILKLQDEINKFKIELADAILSNNINAKEEEYVTYLGVRFKDKEKIYTYIYNDDQPVNLGDQVIVVTPWGKEEFVTVVDMTHTRPDNGFVYQEAYAINNYEETIGIEI